MEEKKTFEIVTHGPSETMEIGAKIGESLRGGEVICFVGNLGTGKTHLIKGIARGLGAEDTGVNSPTFVLVNEYIGEGVRLDAYHIDAYRLESVKEFEMLGFDELCYPDSVVMIEWADKVESYLEGLDYVEARLEHEGESERKIILKNLPGYLYEVLTAE
ncbi:ADP-binding protein [Anaerohalosphaera lusitana]|uniref:tRNA threonylcarbamoyladenosine biosynthesis protein TsaE n=2 Tax=Anaerohalosphaera lusitana TaxID=1936003 RepID=A0A1U9NLU0_9BACT|nr:ADP-binding protein [Anaerohalosphaera lusitana]